jgi:hypothetical protein
MRNAQFPRRSTPAQHNAGGLALSRISRAAAVSQNVSVDEESHFIKDLILTASNTHTFPRPH